MPSRNALDVRILRLRRRVADLGLAVRTVRHRGYLLEIAAVRNGSAS
jgi:DNA-binding response OmpR family regulator